jgi:hypothetical protein
VNTITALLYLFGTIFAVSAGVTLGVGSVIGLLLWALRFGQDKATGKHANGSVTEHEGER